MISIKELYEIIVVIGEGTYGEVYKAQDIITKEFVALKKIKRQFSDGFPETSIREIALNQSVGQHQNITNLIKVVTDRNLEVYLVFEYTEYDLEYIIKRITLSENHIKSYMRQMLFGLYVLHSKYIYHRDLKPSNILVNASNIIKITDFGLARQIFPYEQRNRKKPMTSKVISLMYRPLELFFKAPFYGPEVDIWSLGCIFYEMITRKQLFYSPKLNNSNPESMNEIFLIQQIFTICGYPTEEDWPEWKFLSENSELFKSSKVQSTGNLDSFLSSELPKEFMKAKPLLLGMLQLNPAKRKLIDDLLTDEFLHNINNSLDPKALKKLMIPEKTKIPKNQDKNRPKTDDLGAKKVIPKK